MLASSVGRVSVPENRTQYESFELRPFTPHIGAEIRGLDVSKPLSDAQAIELDQAFAEWMVLAIRDQHLTRDQHKVFGRRFRKLHVHPMHAAGLRGADPEILPVKTDANVAYTAGDGWHTDVTCDEIPPNASMLYVTETPECVTDRASAATDSADRQRHATESRRQNATESRNAQLSVVRCKPLLGGELPRWHLELDS